MDPNEECRGAFERALDDLADLGAIIVPVSLPGLPILVAAQLLILGYEAFRTHRHRLRSHWAALGRPFRQTIAIGCVVGHDVYRHAQQVRIAHTRKLRRILSAVDVLATPTWPTAAPRFDDPSAMSLTSQWPGIANVTGVPAMALPMGFDRDGLPLSLQLMGQTGDESRLAVIADVYQQHTGWHRIKADCAWARLASQALPLPCGSQPASGSSGPDAALRFQLREAGLEPDDADLAQMSVTWQRLSGLVDLVRAPDRRVRGVR
jgi:aspartyl-tRNA(Asn)/glutamyl-tRNA(Gln) amidotransferase subunit A